MIQVHQHRQRAWERRAESKDRAGASYGECVTVVTSLEQECIHIKLATFHHKFNSYDYVHHQYSTC